MQKSCNTKQYKKCNGNENNEVNTLNLLKLEKILLHSLPKLVKLY